MSCFRCEKDLPVGQVECDPPCDEVLAHGHHTDGQSFRALIIEVPMNEQAVRTRDAELRVALRRFSELLGDAIRASGLDEFMRGDKGGSR